MWQTLSHTTMGLCCHITNNGPNNVASVVLGWRLVKRLHRSHCSAIVDPPIILYRRLPLRPLSRGATAGKGSLREALSNNDRPADLYTVTLSFHTLPKTAIVAEARGEAPGRAGNAIYKNRRSLFRLFHK